MTLTSSPHAPHEYNLNASDKTTIFDLDEEIEGIHVHRVRHANIRDNIFIRGLEHFLLSGYYYRRYRELRENLCTTVF